MFYIVTKSNCINCNILKKSLDGKVILHKYVDITNDLDTINHLSHWVINLYHLYFLMILKIKILKIF